jgi:hypothetical protein
MKHTVHKKKRHDADADAEASNGHSAAETKDQSDGQAAERPVMDRAEEMVDHFGEQVGQYASQAGQVLNRWLARAREELEDMWAEAQSIRGNWKPQP